MYVNRPCNPYLFSLCADDLLERMCSRRDCGSAHRTNSVQAFQTIQSRKNNIVNLRAGLTQAKAYGQKPQ